MGAYFFVKTLRCSSPKESVLGISDLVVIWDVILALWLSNQNLFTQVSSDDSGYISSLVAMAA